jgi:hypothetical protein
MRSLPYQGAKHGAVDRGDTSDGVFLLLRGHRGTGWTSSSTCGRLLGPDESFSRMISSIICRSNLSTLWMTSRVYGSISSKWQHPPQLRVEASSCSRKGGPNWRKNGVGRPTWADWHGPTSTWFDHPFPHVCPLVVTTRLPKAGPAYAWQLSRTPRISPQTNRCLSCALCPYSCTPGKASRSVTHCSRSSTLNFVVFGGGLL